MAIGVAHIKEERVRDAVSTGAALQILQETARRHHVAEMQYVHRGRHPVAEMMQARPLAVGDGKVMHVALPMQPGGGDAPLRSIFFRIFGQAESEPGVKVHGVLHFGGEDVEMVEPLRMAAAIEVVPSQEMRALLHGGVKLDLETEGVGDLQGAALERLLGESVLDAVLGEEARRLVEIALIADLEAEPAAGGRLR